MNNEQWRHIFFYSGEKCRNIDVIDVDLFLALKNIANFDIEWTKMHLNERLP
jgi:hypothetical protein